MNVRREWITPITAGAFLLSVVTSTLIFFHIDTGPNKSFHQWLSSVLLGNVALHATANFAGFKCHLGTRRGLLLMGVFALVLLLGSVPLGKKDTWSFAEPIRALSQVPLTTLAQVAQVSQEQVYERLTKEGLQPKSGQQNLRGLVGTHMRRQVQVLGMLLAAAK